jgi:hypothetical protein
MNTDNLHKLADILWSLDSMVGHFEGSLVFNEYHAFDVRYDEESGKHYVVV